MTEREKERGGGDDCRGVGSQRAATMGLFSFMTFSRPPNLLLLLLLLLQRRRRRRLRRFRVFRRVGSEIVITCTTTTTDANTSSGSSSSATKSKRSVLYFCCFAGFVSLGLVFFVSLKWTRNQSHPSSRGSGSARSCRPRLSAPFVSNSIRIFNFATKIDSSDETTKGRKKKKHLQLFFQFSIFKFYITKPNSQNL